MMLSERIAFLYQAVCAFFVISMMLDIKPIILATLYIMVFLAIYAVIASRPLRRITASLFPSSMTINPNPSRTGERVRVRASIAPIKKGLPAMIRLELGDLELVDGSKTWSGLLKGDPISLSFSVKSMDPGIKLIGPLKLALMDSLGVVVKELEIHPKMPIFFLEADKALSHPTSYSLSKHPSPGLSRSYFMGVDHEYRISQPQEIEPPARKIDWKRTAQRGDERIYLKLYDKLMRGDLMFGLGSGLDIILPDGVRLESRIVQDILAITLPHLREGSKIWLMRWIKGKGLTSSLIERSRVIEVLEAPKITYLIYVTRLIDEEEQKLLKRLSSEGALIKLILIDLGSDLLKISDEEWLKKLVDLERMRLKSRVDQLNIPYSMTSLELFGESLRRIMMYRRAL